MVGLGAVSAASGTACQTGGGDYQDDDGSGEDGEDYPSAVSTYGVGPSTTVSSTTGGGLACTAFPEDTSCGVCLNASCCDSGSACNESAACLSFMTCLSACAKEDLVCAAGCQEQDPDGYDLYQALYQCGSAACPDCLVP